MISLYGRIQDAILVLFGALFGAGFSDGELVGLDGVGVQGDVSRLVDLYRLYAAVKAGTDVLTSSSQTRAWEHWSPRGTSRKRPTI